MAYGLFSVQLSRIIRAANIDHLEYIPLYPAAYTVSTIGNDKAYLLTSTETSGPPVLDDLVYTVL